MSTHALLSPSSASRWLACTPSARLELQFPNTASAAAAEGSAAHELCEMGLKHVLGLVSSAEIAQTIETIKEYYCETMQEHVDEYVDFVAEKLVEARLHTPDAVLGIEQRLDMTAYVPDGFGTGDAVIVADGAMEIIDFKYGKGVPVYAENNKQMMLYAIGALNASDFMYDISYVKMTIFQPRLGNISTWGLTVNELRSWAETHLLPLAQMAFEGKGEFKVGEHCRFCRAKARCSAQAKENLKIAAHDFKSPALLSDADLEEVLGVSDRIKKWLDAVEQCALREAVDNGKQWAAYKLVEGRSNRVYTDPDRAADVLIKNGYDENAIFDKTLLGITAMEKYLTKKMFTAMLGDYVAKPQGKPTLVPMADKRPAWNSHERAVSDFSNN